MVTNGNLILDHDTQIVIIQRSPKEEQEKGEASNREGTSQAEIRIEPTVLSKPPEIPSHREEKEESINTNGNDVNKRPSSAGTDPERKSAALQKDEDAKGKAEHEQGKSNSRKKESMHLDNNEMYTTK